MVIVQYQDGIITNSVNIISSLTFIFNSCKSKKINPICDNGITTLDSNQNLILLIFIKIIMISISNFIFDVNQHLINQCLIKLALNYNHFNEKRLYR